MKRTQKQRPYTDRKKKILIILVPAILIIIAAMLIISGIFIRKNNISKTAEFVPPEYESMAQEGIPSLDESYLYGEVPTKFNYGFSMAMNLYMQKDKSLNVYFTNPATNTMLLRIVVEDSSTGEKLYESGVLKPGQYIESLQPADKDMINKAYDVTVRVYAYKPDSWYSGGTTTAQLKLQPW